MNRVRVAKMSRGFARVLPGDVKGLVLKTDPEEEGGRKKAWANALGKGPYTEIKSWSVKELVLTQWQIAMKYDRDPGEATSRFLGGLKRGKLLGTKCESCGRILLPPRIFCEWCFKDVEKWVELSGVGEVATYSVSYVKADPRERLEEPIIVCVVWLEGTKISSQSSANLLHAAGLLHLLGEVKPEEVKVGMKVRVVWAPVRQRKGSILDIKYFAPVR